MPAKHKNPAEAFWKNVDICGEDECWEWKRSRKPSGYGQFQFQGKLWISSRLAYFLKHGSIPDGLFICHSCDNPPCCNPSHLFAGTRLDNARDMVRKGRSANGDRSYFRRHPERVVRLYGAKNGISKHPERANRSFGESNPMNTKPQFRPRGDTIMPSVLSSRHVFEIRRRAAAGEKQIDLARIFGVHFTTINKIVKNVRRALG